MFCKRPFDAYYTPAWLADIAAGHLLREAGDFPVIDPACGDGRLLFAVHKKRKAQEIPRFLGLDIRPDACRVARKRLAHVPADVFCRDALDPAALDFMRALAPCNVIMNSPYANLRGMSEKERLALRTNFKTVTNNVGNLAIAFLELATIVAAARGGVSALVPVNLLFSDAAARLRATIAHSLILKTICDFGPLRPFAESLANVALIVLGRAADGDVRLVRLTRDAGPVGIGELDRRAYSIPREFVSGDRWFLPDEKFVAGVGAMRKTGRKLSEIARVSSRFADDGGKPLFLPQALSFPLKVRPARDAQSHGVWITPAAQNDFSTIAAALESPDFEGYVSALAFRLNGGQFMIRPGLVADFVVA